MKKMRDGLYLVSWATSDTTNEQTVKVKLDIDDKCDTTLKLNGNGTAKVDLKLLLRLPKEKNESNRILPDVFATKEGQCQVMTSKKESNYNVWSWSTSWACTKRTVNPSVPWWTKLMDCSNESLFGPFSVDVVIDFQEFSKYLNKGEKNVLDHLSKLLKEQTLTDVTFKVKNEALKAHTIILAAGSPVLSAMFKNNLIENRTRIVEIKDTKPAVFKQLLQYIYTGNAPEMVREGMAQDLLVAADKYGVESLKEECILVLIKNLKVENAVSTLVFSHLHSSSKLEEETLLFMSLNGTAICSRKDWMDLMKTYPDLCLQATQFMVDAVDLKIKVSSFILS